MVCSNCGYDVEVVKREKQREIREAIILTRQELLKEFECIIHRCFFKENLLIDNIIETGKNIIGKPADIKFMKNYKLELLELEEDFFNELESLTNQKSSASDKEK